MAITINPPTSKSIAEFAIDFIATAATGAILSSIFLTDAPLASQGFGLVIVIGGVAAAWKLMRSLKWIDK